MQNLSLPAPRAPGRPLAAAAAIAPPWLIAAALLLLLMVLAPVGYLGGGGDDFYYLEAARCAGAHGLCLPHTHWAARFPLVAPMGLAFAVLGVARWSAQLVPFLYALGTVILFALNVERRFGRPAAALAGVALVLTPAVSLHALQPMVELPEFFWVMAALLAGQAAIERRCARFAALSGCALALAVMTRMSALAFLPILGLFWLFVLPRDRRALVLPFGLAFAGLLGAEAAAYWAATGDPLYGWLLSFHHTRIPTTELPPGIDLSRSALFNLDFIRNWKRNMGIHVHWTVDPLLNLLADPECGVTLLAAAALAMTRRERWARDIALPLLAFAAVLHFLILTYALAIDPKPRMFLFDFGVAATVIAVCGVSAWQNGGRPIIAILILVMAMRTLVSGAAETDPRPAEAMAAQWIAATPRPLAIDDRTRRIIALEPSAYALPVAGAATRSPILLLAAESCAQAASSLGAGWRVARAQTVPASAAYLPAALGRVTLPLCLLSPAPDRAPPPR